jgi:hypothetical protein
MDDLFWSGKRTQPSNIDTLYRDIQSLPACRQAGEEATYIADEATHRKEPEPGICYNLGLSVDKRE